VNTQRLVDGTVLGGVVLLGLASYLTWTSADPGGGREVVELSGYDVSHAPATVALASAVALVVLRLAGTAMRRVLCVLLAVLGAAAVLVAVRTRPTAAELATLRPQLSEVVTDHVRVSAGPAPWVALAGGILVLAAGLVGVATAHRWRRPTAKYERDQAATPEDQWKAIDAGEDPTI
jgi:uncharacterized membrane protein (TIGR02234 family)